MGKRLLWTQELRHADCLEGQMQLYVLESEPDRVQCAECQCPVPDAWSRKLLSPPPLSPSSQQVGNDNDERHVWLLQQQRSSRMWRLEQTLAHLEHVERNVRASEEASLVNARRRGMHGQTERSFVLHLSDALHEHHGAAAVDDHGAVVGRKGRGFNFGNNLNNTTALTPPAPSAAALRYERVALKGMLAVGATVADRARRREAAAAVTGAAARGALFGGGAAAAGGWGNNNNNNNNNNSLQARYNSANHEDFL